LSKSCGVERPRRNTAHTQTAQALAHLRGGFGREREGKNLVGLILPLRYAVRDAMSEGSCFSRPRPRKHTQGSAPRRGDHPLCVIETLKRIHH